MNLTEENAAHSLEGRTLKNGWYVEKKIEKRSNDTGGFFSVCYLVTKGDQKAFLKALNFKAFFQMFKDKPVVQIMKEQSAAYEFERNLLLRCKNNKLSKVSLILDEGEERVEGCTINEVPYIIFEMANGDLRSHINFSKDLEIHWKLRSLHNVAVGLRQLHAVQIGHQDLKPSNVLIYDDGLTSKISDLGRSLCENISAPHDNGNFPGDFNYAPPEYFYGYVNTDWNIRVRSTDMYLFGSLIVFYFTGTNMTSLIGKNMDEQFNWNRWDGTFVDVSGYLIDGFYKALREFQSNLTNKELAQELANIVEYCCFPIPEQRGHPKSIATKGNQYNFERTVSKLDVLEKKYKLKFNGGQFSN